MQKVPHGLWLAVDGALPIGTTETDLHEVFQECGIELPLGNISCKPKPDGTGAIVSLTDHDVLTLFNHMLTGRSVNGKLVTFCKWVAKPASKPKPLLPLTPDLYARPQ